MEKNFTSFSLLMLNRTALIIPRGRESNSSDLDITLIELLAYVGDHLSYYQDVVATEASLGPHGTRIFTNKYVRLLYSSVHDRNRPKDTEISITSLVNAIGHNGEKVFIKEKDFGFPLLDNINSASSTYVWLLSKHSYNAGE